MAAGSGACGADRRALFSAVGSGSDAAGRVFYGGRDPGNAWKVVTASCDGGAMWDRTASSVRNVTRPFIRVRWLLGRALGRVVVFRGRLGLAGVERVGVGHVAG